MDIQKLIKENHEMMIRKGFYDCPDCTDRLKLKQKLGAGCHDEVGCETCEGTGRNPNKNISELLALIISELSESLEAHRVNKFASKTYKYEISELKKDMNSDNKLMRSNSFVNFKNFVKDTVEDELGDTILRICDLCGYLDIEITVGRFSANFKDMDFSELFMSCTGEIYRAYSENLNNGDMSHYLQECVRFIYTYCLDNDIPIMDHMTAKMSYNDDRPHKHGKEY
jgi:NTP pyrophosphatase (non-canonical NTP hydrolase)